MKFRFVKTPQILLLTFVLIAFACNNRNNVEKVDREQFVQILVDLHITDAILANKGWYDAKLKDSTRSYYNYILKKYNVTRADFDYSLDYYSNNLEEYAKMYEEVMAIIVERTPRQLHQKSIYKIFEMVTREAEIKRDLVAYYGVNGKELWKGKRTFKLPEDTLNIYTELLDSIQYQCLLAFRAEMKMLPKDSSENLRMKLVINYKDTTNEVVEEKIIKKAGKWKSYKLLLKTDSIKTPVSIEAYLIKRDNENKKLHLELKNISLKQYAPDKDTSLIDSIIPINRSIEGSKKKMDKRKEMMDPD